VLSRGKILVDEFTDKIFRRCWRNAHAVVFRAEKLSRIEQGSMGESDPFFQPGPIRLRFDIGMNSQSCLGVAKRPL
jgi:hypothetical protein